MKKQTLVIVLAALLFFACTAEEPVAPVIIPQPVSMTFSEGYFHITEQTTLQSEQPSEQIWQWIGKLPLKIISGTGFPEKDIIQLVGTDDFQDDREGAYSMIISPDQITIRAKEDRGLFYGMQNLQQLYMVYGNKIPCMTIEDRPRFGHRALMLDVSHHFFPADFVMRQIDVMAMLKMNVLMLYLGGEGGWRLESNIYPELTQYTAWRPIADYTQWKESGSVFSTNGVNGSYGGYYTQEDFFKIATYAGDRFITVIPAIDFPQSHPSLIHALPELASDLFMEDIILEINDIYPVGSVYVGNGEADRYRGIFCPTCIPKVEAGKTGNPSDGPFTERITALQQTLKDNGIELITWEESIRGILDEGSTVISWNEPSEGLTAAEMGYKVIASPSAYYSLDFYQNAPGSEPAAGAGYLPLAKLYNFNPLPLGFAQEYAGNIEGIQANLWTNYVDTEGLAEYMLYPRLMAAAEAGWSAPEKKSYFDFHKRAARLSSYLGRNGYSVFDLRSEVSVRPESSEAINSLAKAKNISYKMRYNEKYAAGGDGALVDGVRGDWDYNDGRWQGILRDNLDVVIDMGENRTISTVSAMFMQNYAANIWLPQRVEIHISVDNINFTHLFTIHNKLPEEERKYTICPFEWKGSAQARYIRYLAVNNHRPGSWLFTDEIVVF